MVSFSPDPDAPPVTDAPRLILITGNMAAGKSAVAQAVAERLPRSVHLRGDIFRRMIIGGQAEMSFALSDEAKKQLDLRYRIAASAARLHLEAGFTVVYQDIIIGPALAEVAASFADVPLSIFVLCPRPEILAARDAARPKTGYPDNAALLAFDRVLREQTPRLGLWLDTSALTADETVKTVLDYLVA